MRASDLSAPSLAETPISSRLKSDELLPNPFSISDGDNNCIVKAAISYVAGGAMGGILAMFMSGVEMREIELGKQRRSSKIILRKDGRRVMSSARGFASFGGLFVFNQCMLGHMRGKEDALNSFGAGMAAAMISGANIMKGRELVWSGVCGGAICYLFYVGIKMMGYG